jgi:hypothetical protein
VSCVGRASNRKKAQRQAGQKPQPDAATQDAMRKVLAGLQALVRAGAVPPRDILPVGLMLLSALARLCRSNAASLLQPAA